MQIKDENSERVWREHASNHRLYWPTICVLDITKLFICKNHYHRPERERAAATPSPSPKATTITADSTAQHWDFTIFNFFRFLTPLSSHRVIVSHSHTQPRTWTINRLHQHVVHCSAIFERNNSSLSHTFLVVFALQANTQELCHSIFLFIVYVRYLVKTHTCCCCTMYTDGCVYRDFVSNGSVYID